MHIEAINVTELFEKQCYARVKKRPPANVLDMNCCLKPGLAPSVSAGRLEVSELCHVEARSADIVLAA